MNNVPPPTIKHLIDTDYTTVSINEQMQHIARWLQHETYFAVMNEDMKIAGIVTLQDALRHPQRLIIDADIRKPAAYPGQTIFEVYELMEEVHADYLPVFEQDEFVGVISFRHLVKRIIDHLQELKNDIT